MGVVGLAENKANSAQLELEAGAELGKRESLLPYFLSLILSKYQIGKIRFVEQT